jgi:hypothetical protein
VAEGGWGGGVAGGKTAGRRLDHERQAGSGWHRKGGRTAEATV